ncbi:MAG: serine hydrolase, partial [Acidobacteriota bacterium]|nr:serine hydrolase [Acidobacteriota bacterium]
MKTVLIFLLTLVLLPIFNFPATTVASIDVRAEHPRSPVVQASPQNADKLAAFEAFVRQQMVKDKIPGMTIGFFKDDFGWVKGFGYADVENKIPARPESAYRLASITKTFTGAAILQLVEKGKMNLDAEIQTYVPYYPKQKWPVTVRQLLVHLGGGQTGSGIGPEYVTPREVVARIAQFPIQNEPGVKFDYQTSGYNLLGAAIEEVTGKPLGEYLRESIWKPLLMNDTRMDNVRELISNRVRGYELVNGEIQNARFIDVSSRFGGGGALGTVPDLLKWARTVDSGRIMSKESGALMYAPVANKDGRYVGLADGEWYYTAGWLVFPINGQRALWNDGGQIGTNTALIRVPSKNLAIAFASNVQEIDRMPYIKRLYELITGEPMAQIVSTRNKFDDALYKGMGDTFNYGSLHFDESRQPVVNDPKELAKAFAYFNRTVDRVALQKNYQATVKAINDGRHPVGDVAFIKVGSYMAMKLAEKHGPARAGVYHAMGSFAFFDDYIKLYKSTKKHPKALRFNKPFELIVTKWNQDWTRTWNEQTRKLTTANEAELVENGEQLKKSFAGAEVYPDFLDQLLRIKQGPGSVKAVKLAVELYPQSARANLVWGIFLILLSRSDVDKEKLEKTILEKEPPLTYIKRSLEIDPEGSANAGSLRQIARGWTGEGRTLEDAEKLLNLAIQLHPQSGMLYEGLGDVYVKQGRNDEATASYKKALELDPTLQPSKEALKKL